MKDTTKRATVYLDSSVHRALRLEAAETDRTVSDLVNEAVRMSLTEDTEDLAAFEERAGEPNLAFEDFLKDLRNVKTISFTVRKNASQVMDEVEKGETVRILRHGKEVARIVPPDLPEPGPAWKRPGLRLVVPGGSLSRAILDEDRFPHDL